MVACVLDCQFRSCRFSKFRRFSVLVKKWISQNGFHERRGPLSRSNCTLPISTPPNQLGVLVSLVDRSCLLCNTFHVATTPVCLSKLPAAWRFSLDDCTWEDCTTRWQRAVWQPLACTGRCKVFNPCRGIFFTLFKPRGDKPLFAYSGRKDLGG